jgi:hypothetical protein
MEDERRYIKDAKEASLIANVLIYLCTDKFGSTTHIAFAVIVFALRHFGKKIYTLPEYEEKVHSFKIYGALMSSFSLLAIGILMIPALKEVLEDVLAADWAFLSLYIVLMVGNFFESIVELRYHRLSFIEFELFDEKLKFLSKVTGMLAIHFANLGVLTGFKWTGIVTLTCGSISLLAKFWEDTRYLNDHEATKGTFFNKCTKLTLLAFSILNFLFLTKMKISQTSPRAVISAYLYFGLYDVRHPKP